MSAALKTLAVDSRREWRQWLAAHHDREGEIWLVFWKVGSGHPSLPFEDALDEAICFGWIDNLIRRLDEQRYARRFMPRRPKSHWTATNRERFARLEAEGKLTAAGRARGPAAADEAQQRTSGAKQKGSGVPVELEHALKKNRRAAGNFAAMPASVRNGFVGWIGAAKRADTRARRTAEAVVLLERNERLSMK